MPRPIQRGMQNQQATRSCLQLKDARCGTNQRASLGIRGFDWDAPRKFRQILVFALGIAFGLAPQPSRAQNSTQYFLCYELCQSNCKDRPNYLEKTECVQNCSMGCKKDDTQPRPYGAIAYGTDHAAEGISWNKGSQAEADRTALGVCSQHGKNCTVVYRFQNTCAALALATGSQHYEANTGGTAKDAEANATAACQRSWGRCETNLSACSLTGARRPSSPPPPKATSWGAIAYSTADMGAGYSQGKSDRASAEKEAMNLCSQRGKACAVRIAFNKECGALAADRNFAGWGASTDMREAQRKAMDDCTKAGGTRCALHIAFCSY